MALTRRQREVLDFISAFIEEQGYSPSLEEIGAGIGCSSIATVHKHITNLQAKGALQRKAGRSRSVEPCERSGGGRQGVATVGVPLLGTVAAGQPIEAIADEEHLTLPEELVGGHETFALRVRGESMIEEQIRDGDIILVERTPTAENGETVVALVDGADVTVKRWYRNNDGTVRLEPANATMEPIVLAADRVVLHGRVVGLLRKY